VALHDVLDVPSSVLSGAFPDPGWAGWHRYQDRYQQGKMICSDISVIPETLAALIEELSRPVFLEFLQKITGIPKLLTDPYLEGGGLHCSGPGGILAPHTDFHLYPRLGIYRRINVLLYLNEQWKESWGGCLELYGAGHDRPAHTIVPEWGTCVIFRTDDGSTHGFSRPIQGQRWRRSVALYYYTADEAEDYSGDTNTYWNRLPVEGGSRRVRQKAYEALLLGSRGLAFFAHRLDPNLSGPRRRRR
jgi:hypothetical protein